MATSIMSRDHTPVTPELARYIREVTLREPEALRRLREETELLPEASLQSAPEQGQLLQLLALAVGARRALEVGVFMGYSSAWVALALPPGGRLIACDRNEDYARRARRTWREAGVEDRVELRLGPALDTLDGLLAEGQAGAFDFAYIDADKGNYSNYYDRVLALVRSGGLIAADNVLWHGGVAGAGDEDAEAIRAFNRKLHGDLRIELSIVPLGDGLAVAYKR
jgi:caffeoyl-CoA O-methyltransferase